MRWGPSLLLSLACCGRAGFDTHAGEVAIDAAAADAGSPDAATGPFGEAQPIEPLSSTGVDDDPSLTGDLTEMYFKSDRGGGADIWVTRRDSVDDAWGEPAPVDELNTPQGDDTPEVSLDGLTITLASDRPGGPGGGIDLYIATRETRDDPWGEPEAVPDLSSAGPEYAAVMDAAGAIVVFNREVAGNGLDLMTAARDGGGWTSPAPLVNLATPAYEADSHLSADGLEIYYTADLAGSQAHDIYRAERGALADDFGPPERVVELATEANDEDPWVSPGGRFVFFSSERSGDREIYWATR